MEYDNAVGNKENATEEFNIDDLNALDDIYEKEIVTGLEDLSFLEDERKKIGNPESLGKIILDEVWTQFGNQIGLDMTNETLIQKYDREHPETYDEVGKKVMQDSRYKDANKEMQQKKQNNELKDEYTGKDIKPNDSANLDHTVSRKEIYENKRRKQAGIPTEDLANKEENLNATNESLNKSKGKKSVQEMVDTREEREAALKAQNERANKKVDESNMSDTEKRLQKEKNDKRLQDKLDANDEMMKKADKKARKAIDHDVRVGTAKQAAKKAGKDALKTMAVSALFALLKEVMNGLIRFFKEKNKSFGNFLNEMKESIKSFINKIVGLLRTGVSSAVGTVISEIFGPIVSVFKKLASIIKQGATTIIDAVHYLADRNNKDKPLSIKIAKVGEIVTTGLVAAGAIFGGEIFEKALLAIPGMQTPLPLLGTLANVIGMFLASMVSGLLGAIIINQLEKFVAKKQTADNMSKQIDKGNEILASQGKQQEVKKAKLQGTKKGVAANIVNRHEEAANAVKDTRDEILRDEANDNANSNIMNSSALDKLLQM